MIGFTGARRTYVDHINTINCAPVAAGGLADLALSTTIQAFPQRQSWLQGNPNSAHSISGFCGMGMVVFAIHGQAGTYLDSFGMHCRTLPGAIPTPTAPRPVMRPPTGMSAPGVTAPAPAPQAPDLEPLLNVPLLLRHIAPNPKLHATYCTGIPTGSTFSMQMITVPDVRWGITNTGDGDATGTFRAELRAGNSVLQSHTVNGLAAGETRWFSYQRPQSTTQVGRVPMNPTQTLRAQYVATGNECVQVIPQRQQIHEWMDPAGVVANDSNPSNNARTF